MRHLSLAPIGNRAGFALIALLSSVGCHRGSGEDLAATTEAAAEACYAKFSHLDGKSDARRSSTAHQFHMYGTETAGDDSSFVYVVGSRCMLPNGFDSRFFRSVDWPIPPKPENETAPEKACWAAWERYYGQFNAEMERLNPTLVNAMLKGSTGCQKSG